MMKLEDFKEFAINKESKIFGGFGSGIPTTWNDSHHGTNGDDWCNINEDDTGFTCSFRDLSDVC